MSLNKNLHKHEKEKKELMNQIHLISRDNFSLKDEISAHQQRIEALTKELQKIKKKLADSETRVNID